MKPMIKSKLIWLSLFINFFISFQVYANDTTQISDIFFKWTDRYNAYIEEIKKVGQTEEIKKIKSWFDFLQEQESLAIEQWKQLLLEKIKDQKVDEIVDLVSQKVLDIILKTSKDGYYIVMWLWSWDLLSIWDDYLYIFPYNIEWNFNAISQIKNEVEIAKNNVLNKKSDLTNLEKLLKWYKIKYIKINKNTDINATLYIWNKYWIKNQIQANFISNIVTVTPELKQYEKDLPFFVYTYITKDELINVLWNDYLNKDIIVTLGNMGSFYLWFTNNLQKVYVANLQNKWEFIYQYNIEKRFYEYYILIWIFILGLLGWFWLIYKYIYTHKKSFSMLIEDI